MSTRGYIGYEYEPNKVKFIYNHYDSDLPCLGKLLYTSNPEKIMKAIDDGDDGVIWGDDKGLRMEDVDETTLDRYTSYNDVFIEFTYLYKPIQNKWYVKSTHVENITTFYNMDELFKSEELLKPFLKMYYEEYQKKYLEELTKLTR